MVIEFHNARTPFRQAVHTASNGYVDLWFRPQSRYCGALALEVPEVLIARDLLSRPGLFRPYTGPIVDFIPEGMALEAIDWTRLTRWIIDNAPVPQRDELRIALEVIDGKDTSDAPPNSEPASPAVPSTQPARRGRPARR